ncbi:Capsule assembly protein Wzi [Spirosomataceae bacterium TFI 002]|nr:Capsule assembly protein Wzi [Spirosomataceae bacterium TFI 002]
MKYLLLSILLVQNLCSAQSSWDGNTYSLESNLFVSTDSILPFWTRSQSYGEIPVESQFVQLKGSIHHEYDSTYKIDKRLQHYGFGHGASFVGNLGKVNQFLISEAFVKARYGVFEMWAGRRREIIGLVDSTLSTGSLIWGGNSLPIPKVQLAIPNYTPIIGKGLISIKGTFSHGWFGSTDSVKNYFLHQKTFYARIGKPNWKFKFYAGFNHQVQWAGAPAVPFYDPRTDQIISAFPKSLSTYMNVVSGLSSNRKGDQVISTNGVPYNEAFNRAGNHLGTLDIAFEYNFDQIKLFVYRQSIYEDGSLFFLSNIQDGLLGVSFTPVTKSQNFLKLKKINFEYLDSRSQGGRGGSGNVIPELRGQDNYFNNSLYEDGWTYKSRTLANSFFIPLNEYSYLLPNASSFISSQIFNSRLTAFSSTLNIEVGKHNILGRYSRSDNYGNYRFELNEIIQHSMLFNWKIEINKYKLNASIASDWGKFLGTRASFNVGLARRLYR